MPASSRRRYFCSTRGCDLQWRNVKGQCCASCGGTNTPLKRVSRNFANANVYVQPVIHEHYNVSLDCVVRGRTHLRQLQRERNVQDYEPQKHARRGFLNGPGRSRTRYVKGAD